MEGVLLSSVLAICQLVMFIVCMYMVRNPHSRPPKQPRLARCILGKYFWYCRAPFNIFAVPAPLSQIRTHEQKSRMWLLEQHMLCACDLAAD